MTGRPSMQERIVQALEERFPDRGIPRGVLHAMDEEFGVTRNYCRTIARKYGFAVPGREGRVGTCRSCGRASTPDSIYCFECQHLEVSCARCGQTFRRRRSNVRADRRHAFCSARCHAESMVRGSASDLARRRVAAAMSQQELAKKLQVSRSTISLWEHGKEPISSRRIRELEGVFGQRGP